MELSKARQLIQKYREGTLTKEEKSLLESWYLELAKSDREMPEAGEIQAKVDAVWASLPVSRTKHNIPKRGIRRIFSYASAASILLLCMLGGYFLYNDSSKIKPEEKAEIREILPGGNKAVLTLGNGIRIELDEHKSGELAREGDITIFKTQNDEIVYETSGLKEGGSDIRYNTVATPKAGQYQVKLPDGTRAWLNASSSIRFPSYFPDHERVVEIKGEVYFEVAKRNAHNKRVPFKVLAGQQLVEVLGTRFNINSYSDEDQIKTTLVEGSIKVNVNKSSKNGVLLKPGEQSQLLTAASKSRNEHGFSIKKVDPDAVIAWKDGFFRFDNVGLQELMRQLSRWYDVEIEYGTSVKHHEFVGRIERRAPLSKVLKILEMGDVHFKVEGKKIIVTE